MALRRRTIIVLQASCALIASASADGGSRLARADVPMLSRHASFEGDLAIRTGGGAQPVAPSPRVQASAAGQDDAVSSVDSGPLSRAREALFADGFQPPAT